MARRYTSPKDTERYAVPLAPETGRAGDDDPLTVRMAQVIARLPRRQRTIVVLGSFHDEDDRQIAETLEIPHDTVVAERSLAMDALHIGGFWPVDAPAPGGRREPERVTEDDLQRALEALAHAELGPDADDLVAGAQRRARRAGRRRRARWLAAAAAVLTLGGAGLVFGDTEREPAPLVEPAVPDPDYTGGYGLVDGEPAPYTSDGLRLLHTAEVGPAGRWMARVEPSGPGPVYAVAWCSGEEGGEDADPSVTLWTEDRVDLWVTLPCHMLQDGPAVPVQAVPVVGELWSVDNPMTLETARVALYEEVPWSDFPFSAAAASEAPSPGHDVGAQAVLDAEAEVVQRPDLAEVAGTESTFSVTTPMTPDSELVLASSQDGPGQLLVAVDGVVVTNDNEALGPASTRDLVAQTPAVPDLRAGFRVNFAGDVAQSVLALDSDTLTDLGVDLSDGEVVVSAVPAGTAPGAWSVEISRNDYTPAASTVLPRAVIGELPAFAYGLRKAGEFRIPTDGRERQLDLGPDAAAEATWVVTCPDHPPGDVELLTVTGSLAGESVPCVVDDPWLLPLTDWAAVQPSPTELPVLGVRTEQSIGAGTPEPAETVQVGAYLPVAWEDYPFEESIVTPASGYAVAPGDTVSSGTDDLNSVYVETDRVSLTDLDEQGRAVLELEPSQFTDLVIATEGVGRFRLEVGEPGGQPVGPSDLSSLPYASVLERDGWWSSWTAQPSTWEVPVTGWDDDDATQNFDEIVVTVEGYAGGSLEISALSLLPGDD